jgi:hypothetical protein
MEELIEQILYDQEIKEILLGVTLLLFALFAAWWFSDKDFFCFCVAIAMSFCFTLNVFGVFGAAAFVAIALGCNSAFADR